MIYRLVINDGIKLSEKHTSSTTPIRIMQEENGFFRITNEGHGFEWWVKDPVSIKMTTHEE